jgi:hypothetical protein
MPSTGLTRTNRPVTILSFLGAAAILALLLLGVVVGVAFLFLFDVLLFKMVFGRDKKKTVLPPEPTPMVEDAWHTPLPMAPKRDNSVSGKKWED